MQSGDVIEWDDYRIEGESLWKAGRLVELEAQCVQVLRTLAAQSPQVVSRGGIVAQIWGSSDPNQHRHSLEVCINKIRSVLPDGSVKTVSKRGYQFVLGVKRQHALLDTVRFVGREDLLRAIRETLGATGSIVLYGSPGVGTTRLADEYIKRYRHSYKEICRLDAAKSALEGAGKPGQAGQKSVIDSSYAILARQLRLQPEARDGELVRDGVLKWLNSNGGWLLFIDDVTSHEIKEHLPLPEKGHVLVTSHSAHWRSKTIPVPPLTREEAASLLQETTSQDDRDTALQLADELGCLPRALVQASDYIRSMGYTLLKYRDELRERVGTLSDTPRETSIAASFHPLFQTIGERHPYSKALMNLCAFFAPTPIPQSVFTDWIECLPEDMHAGGSGARFQEAFMALRDSSLVDVDWRLPCTFKANSVVQRLAQDGLGRRLPEWVEAALRLIRLAFPSNSSDPKTWDECSVLLPHALTISGHATIHRIEGPTIEPQGNTVHADLWKRITDYLATREDPAAAHAEMDLSIDLLQSRSGTDSPDLVAPLNRLAVVLRDAFEQTGNEKHREKASQYQQHRERIVSSPRYRDANYSKVEDEA